MSNLPPTMTPPIDEVMLDGVRTYLRQHQWLTVGVPQDSMIYTLGLTAYGLSELVVRHVATPTTTSTSMAADVDRWAARCLAGELTLAASVTVVDGDLREHRFTTRGYDVAARGGLHLAQALYGPRLTAREIDIRSCRCLLCQRGVCWQHDAGTGDNDR